MISYTQWCKENTDINGLAKRLRSSFPEQVIGFYLSESLSIPIEYAKEFYWLGRRSIDIYLPTLNLAIEYDGGRYHREQVFEDQDKTNLCKEYNIRMIRIREDMPEQLSISNAIIINYSASRKYTNIADPIQELFQIINSMYDMKLVANVDTNRDRDRILSYVQQKYYIKSMAFNWPETFDYWIEKEKTPFDLFVGDNVSFKCPHCGNNVEYRPKYHSHRKSLVPCSCEYKGLEDELKRVKRSYKETGELIMLDNSFYSRRLYDRMISDIKYFCNSIEELSMYVKMGIDIGWKRNLLK